MNMFRFDSKISRALTQKCVTLVIFILAGLPVVSQTRMVTGIVTVIGKNESIPGVSVFQKGTTLGTITDPQGKFSIEASDTTTLVFTSIGYGREEIRVGNRQMIEVSLTEDFTGLDEVVVVGYGEQKRS